MQYLLYGANGYTAQIMLGLTNQYGITPILAGRSEEKIKPLADQYGFEYRIFDLADPAQTDAGLRDIKVVLHCAGPFLYTARPMMEACLRNQVHYLDITGEIDVFELAASLNTQALDRGITILPGVGFDVVPTDCIAKMLHEAMPDATHLRLAFANSGGSLSHGTSMTMAEGLGQPGKIRKDGKIINVPLGHKGETIDFGGFKRFCMCIPWGDVSTAYYTTGIPNIEVMTQSSPKAFKMLRWQWAYNWILRTSWSKNRLRSKIATRPAGPTDEKRTKAKSYIWGEVTNAKGEVQRLSMQTLEGYTLTAHTALLICSKILAGEGKPGFWTPAGLFGSAIIHSIGER